jgi:hypothetical protein
VIASVKELGNYTRWGFQAMNKAARASLSNSCSMARTGFVFIGIVGNDQIVFSILMFKKVLI